MFISKSTQTGLVAQIKKQNKGLSGVLERLSTAKRINRASDDAAGLSIAENLMSQIRGFRAASNNTAHAQAAVQIGEGATNEISSMLQRQRELAIQASSDTLNDDQRTALNQEYQALTEEIDRVANTSEFNGQSTANGTGVGAGDAEVQAGANPGEQITMPEVNVTASNLNIDATSIATAADARNAVSALDNAMATVNTQRSNAGAFLNRMDHVTNNLNNQEINTQAAEALIRDMDMARGISDMVRQSVLTQSAGLSLRNYNQISSQNMMALLQ